MKHLKRKYLLYCLMPLLLNACSSKSVVDEKFHFVQVPASASHIDFANTITENDSINVFTNEYMYNGSGVGIGDFNNDGLEDVFFCGSMVSSKLYLNKGNFNFEDITVAAGVETGSWCTGVSVADVNGDGYPDLYVCTSHSANAAKRTNLLFINDGATGKKDIHFTEQAAAYGLADIGYATQAAFIDYDNDGDLDLYIANHRLYSHTANNLQPIDTSGHSPAQDKLYRNDGTPAGGTHPVFTDVTAAAGIKEDGYGLGVVVADVNADGWPDIYVANDYIGNDLLWLNNRNGSFSNAISTSLRHQSYNSMGVDAADINNDGLPDIAVVDMLPETNERKKMMFSAASQEKYDMQQRFGYQPSFMRNMLQLNNGIRNYNGQPQPIYSEIGQMAGIFETDWSWSVLMADFDNDGWKDVHITNGLVKDLTNNDYASFRNGESNTSNYTFGANGAQKPLDHHTTEKLRATIDQFGSIRIDNYFFHNDHELGFSNHTVQAGLSMPSISNGAAYVDLDNDGDLDLVVNNINQEAFIWKNELRKQSTDSAGNFISIALRGNAGNLYGFGSKVTVFANGTRQMAEQNPVRGFSSSVDPRLHFGLDSAVLVDSIVVQWQGGRQQVLRQVKANQLLTVNIADAVQAPVTPAAVNAPLFTDISSSAAIDFTHTESQHFDFGYHQPLPQKYSQLGPCIAAADINGDGLQDFFVGGAANQSGKIFIQQAGGTFTSANLVEGTKREEDLGAIFFDADGDKDLDLLVAGGSFEFEVSSYNQPRLYINDGTGKFSLDPAALPAIPDITKAVTVADYDGDGDLDIFIGGRLLPQKYPQSPRSYLLQNNGGKFTDVTKSVCSGLAYPGMIDGALFTDFNHDQQPDLVICGEFTPVRFFENRQHKLVEITATTGLQQMSGLWRSLQQADVDNDGDMDYIAGNMGLNNRYHITDQHPMFLYSKDMDQNGYDELIPAYYIRDNDNGYQLFPGLDRTQLSEQVPAAKKKYLLHADYAKVTMDKLSADFGSGGWTKLECETAASVWIENLGNGKFKAHTLPVMAQVAPVNCIVAKDIDDDGNVDLLLAGNEYQAAVSIGRYDASYGLVLKGNGKGDFTPVNITKSGLLIDGDVKSMATVDVQKKGTLLLAAPNDRKLSIFLLNQHHLK